MRAMSPKHRQQCRRFLAELRRTGNITLSADRAGVAKLTLRRCRDRSPAFATQWDAALAYARATLADAAAQSPRSLSPKTAGGEYSVRRGKNGEMQVRRAQPGILSDAGETLFLRELAATCNIALACRAVGITPGNIHKRRRRSDQFADRMNAALAHGYERLESALMESALCSLAPEEMAAHWAELGVEPPSPLTVMSFDQVIISMGMHMKRVALVEKRRPRNEHATTAEETDAATTKLLDNLDKRKRALERLEQREAAEAIVGAPGGAATLALEAPEKGAVVPGAGDRARVRVLG